MYRHIVLIIFVVIMSSIFCQYDYTCDYQFGDPSWNYSKIFYNKVHVIPPDVQSYLIYLTESDLIISFVCINMSDIEPNHAKVSFASLFKRITIDFEYPNGRDVLANVLAMHHGYRRYIDV